jgi:Carboxypeptidase regulatory-like domain/TonB dependent receptor
MTIGRCQFKTFLLLLTLLAIPALNIYGQAISGNLVGTITDPSGATVPNASVTATNVATNVKWHTVTNNDGQYRLNNLPPGTYTLSAEATGFTRGELQQVAVQLNQTATANLAMQLSSSSTTVSVVESAAVIDTTNAQIQSTFTAKQAADLPNASIGSGVLNLSLLSAGVTSAGGLGAASGPSVGGQRPRNNNFTVEGVDNNSKSVTGPQVYVPNDAVSDFTVLQNQFQAEFGHSSGGQFNTIVRSGTNQFHGSLYEYMRNRMLNAVDQSFANQGIYSAPRYDNNRLGATIGGPILKDKWFYFANFEYNPLGQQSTTGNPVYAPTAEGYSLLSGVPGVSKTNLGILQKYATAPAVTTGDSVPGVSMNGLNIPLGIVPTAGPNYTNTYAGVVSSDYNISDRDQLRGRFIYNKVTSIDPSGAYLPVFFSNVPTTNYLATLAWFHTFTPTLTNEFRLGYNRQNQSFPVADYSFPGLDQFPNLVFNDLGLGLGPNSNYPQFNVNNLYQGVDNLTWTKGNHTFKFGTEFRKYIAPSLFVQRARGDYEYTTLNGYLFDQTPDYIAQRGLGNATYYGDQIASYSYAQDTWRVRPNLTLDLGVRYEYSTVPYSERLQSENAIANVPGLLTFQSPTAPTTNFVPRIGIAYTPGGSQNTVIRAGFGMAYDILFDNLGTLSLPPQFSVTADVTGGATPAGGFLANGAIPPNASTGGPLSAEDARALTSAYIPNQKLPYSINWNFGIQHVFAQNYTLELRYVGTRGVHLPVQVQLNRIGRITPTSYIPTFLTQPSAATLAALPVTLGDIQARSSFDPAYEAAGFTNTITSYQPEGSSTYHGLSVQLNRRFSNGLQFIGAYTWSHAIDNSTAEVYSTELTPRRPQDFRNLRAERSSSLLDRRHRLTLSVIYDTPWFKGRNNWIVKNILGNWEVAPIYTYESPEYYTVQSGVDANLNQDSAGDRAIVNASGVPGTGSGVNGLDRNGNVVDPDTSTTNPIVAYVATNPNAQYIQAQRGALATAGRNTLPTRPIDNIDLTLLKRFNITERVHLELAGQAFNLFNHAQFVPGYLNDIQPATSNTGLSTYTNPQSPAFNNPELIFSSHPRVVQVFAKFNW